MDRAWLGAASAEVSVIPMARDQHRVQVSGRLRKTLAVTAAVQSFIRACARALTRVCTHIAWLSGRSGRRFRVVGDGVRP